MGGRRKGTAWGEFGASSKKYRKGTLSLGFGEKFGEVEVSVCSSLMVPSSNGYYIKEK